MKQYLRQQIHQNLSIGLNQVIAFNLHYLEMQGSALEQEIIEESEQNPYLSASFNSKKSIYFPFVKDSVEYNDELNSHYGVSLSNDAIVLAKEEILYMNLSSKEKWIAEIIISSIDDDGSLNVSLEQISHYAKLDLALIQHIFNKLKEIFPFLHFKGEDFLFNYFSKIFLGNSEAFELATTILSMVKNLLKKKETLRFESQDELFQLIHKFNQKLDVETIHNNFSSLQSQFMTVMNMVSSIRSTEENALHLLKPDIIVELDRKNLAMEAKVFNEKLPILTIKDKKVSENLTEQEIKDFKKAKMIVEAFDKRNFSMSLFVDKIFQVQWRYFFEGNKFKVPLTMADASKLLNVHVSSISRLVKNKYYYLEGKIKPLKDVFERGFKTTTKEKVSKSLVLETILKILSLQNQYGKVTDKVIQGILEKKGIFISRRAVNKYRHILLKTHQEENAL